MNELLPFIPEFLSFLIVGAAFVAIYRLEILHIEEIRKRAPAKERKRSGDTIVVVEPGIIKTILRDRFAQLGVLLIAVPDIPGLIKMFSGG